MTVAQFTPGNNPGDISGGLIRGLDAGASLMQRAQDRRLAEENAQMRRQHEQDRREQLDIMRPAFAAKAAADLAQANNTVAGMEQTEIMRGLAHTEMPSIREEWMRASQVDDATERVGEMARVISRAAKFESVGELSGEIKIWKDVLAHGFTTARTLDAITGRQVVAETRADAAKTASEQRGADALAKQEVANQGRAEVATIRANAPKAPTKLEREIQKRDEAIRAGDEETASLHRAQIEKLNAIPGNTAAGFEAFARGKDDAEAQLRDAQENGTPEEIAHWQRRVQSWEDKIRAINSRGVRRAESDPLNDPRARALLGDSTAAPAAATQPKAGVASPPPAAGSSSNPFDKIKL